MTLTSSTATRPSWAHVRFIRSALVSIGLSAVLAACQSTQSALPTEGDAELGALAINVSPVVSGSEDLAGQTVRGVIVVSVPQGDWISSVRFVVDGEQRHMAATVPFEYELDTRTLADGAHVLTVEALRKNGRVGASKSAEFVVANGSDEAGVPADESDPPSARGPAPTTGARGLTLRGDPTFDPSRLTALERGEHDRLWSEIRDSGNFAAVMELAGSDDIFTYGRTLHGYLQSVLTAFRVTGDLRLLDHVDEVAERMRQELRDEWRGTNDGTDGTRDGYLNWVYRYSDTPSLQGKDTRHIDDIKAHGIVAMFAYALELNRDLVSPGGRDYGAHADFWRDYLVNHFEAKWRERRDVASAFPFLMHPDAHTYWTWAKWHLYMGMLTGDQGYTIEANRMADVIWNEIKSASTSGGSALVWASNITEYSTDRNFLMSTGYAHSVYGDVVTFHLEGFHRWADEATVRAFARTVTEFVFDTSDPAHNGIASDIGGGEDRAGIVSGSGTPRRSASSFVGYQYGLIGSWDVSGQLIDVTHSIQEEHGSLDTTRLAAGLLLSARMHPVAVADAINGTSSLAAAR